MSLTTARCEAFAENCNDRKLASKMVSEASGELFFAVFVQKSGPLQENAVVRFYHFISNH